MRVHRRRHTRSTIPTLSLLTALAGFAATLPTPTHATGGRLLMERCVDSVLSRLARAKAAEARVGPAILSECEGALQVALADAIESGEAPAVCKVGVCLSMARSRAAQEATEAYRRRVRS